MWEIINDPNKKRRSCKEFSDHLSGWFKVSHGALSRLIGENCEDANVMEMMNDGAQVLHCFIFALKLCIYELIIYIFSYLFLSLMSVQGIEFQSP